MRALNWRKPKIALSGFLVWAVCLTAVSGFAGRKPKEAGPVAQLRKAPGWAKSLRNPYEGQAEAVAVGQKLYAKHCAECHGPDGRGMEHAANLRSSAIQSAPSGVLFWAVRNGRMRRGMPSWSRLPDEQLWQLVTYIKSLRPVAP